MSITTAQALPPKMGAQFVELARQGKADLFENGYYKFVRGNQIITLNGLTPGGFVEKARPGEIDDLRKRAEKLKDSQPAT